MTGFAVPFYLAHPRLMRLEREEMLEVEGGPRDYCMKLLRHEAGHALDNAYGLHNQKRWRDVFGRFSSPYRAAYTPNPVSRDFVVNLEYFYSQSHPAEDWAETFAVWLGSGDRWRTLYRAWPRALAKLEFVDGLMREIANEKPKRRTRRFDEALADQSMTLREYYQQKKRTYQVDEPSIYDRKLQEICAADGEVPGDFPRASVFLRRHGRALCRRVAQITGHHPYLVAQILGELIPRCRKLRLRCDREDGEMILKFSILITTLTDHVLLRRRPRYLR